MNKILLFVGLLIIILVAGILLLSSKNRVEYHSLAYSPSPTPILSPTPTPQKTNTLLTPEPSSIAAGIPLTVTSPLDQDTVTTATIRITGKTGPDADVFVNDTETQANSEGLFSVPLTLDPGDNPIVVVANDANGNNAEKDLTVTYQPSQ